MPSTSLELVFLSMERKSVVGDSAAAGERSPSVLGEALRSFTAEGSNMGICTPPAGLLAALGELLSFTWLKSTPAPGNIATPPRGGVRATGEAEVEAIGEEGVMVGSEAIAFRPFRCFLEGVLLFIMVGLLLVDCSAVN